MRDSCANGGQGVVLGRFRVREAVEAAGHALNLTCVHQAPQSARIYAEVRCVTRSEESPDTEVAKVDEACPRL